MLGKFLRKRKIKKFAKKLPLVLQEMYGNQKYYTQAQVDSAIKRKKLDWNTTSIAYYCYAYAMYCSRDEFNRIHDEAGEKCNYQEMRQDVCDTFSFSSNDFPFSSLLIEASLPRLGIFGSDLGGGNNFSDGTDGGGSDGGGGGD